MPFLGAFDALRHCPAVQLAGHLDDGADDALLGRILVDVVDELAVEFDEIRLEPMQQVQRTVAGTQVVQGHAKPGLTVDLEYAQQVVRITHLVAFHDFEHELLR